MKSNNKNYRDYLAVLQPVIFVAMMIMGVRGIEYIGQRRTQNTPNKITQKPDTTKVYDIRDIAHQNNIKTR